MAKIRGIVKIKGAIGNEVYYELNGKNIVRKKYTQRSFMAKTADSHKKFRDSSKLMRASNAMATSVYRMAKSTGLNLDTATCGKLNGKIKTRLHKDDIDPTNLHYGLVRGVMQGMRLDKVKTALPAHIQYLDGNLRLSTSGLLEMPMLVNIFIGTANCPVWKKGEYEVHTDMSEVEVIQLRIMPGEASGLFNIPLDLSDNQALIATIDGKYCFVI